MGRIRPLSAGGWLRVDEQLAATLIHADSPRRSAVLTWLSISAAERDPALLAAMRESMVAAVTTAEAAMQEVGPTGAAKALRAVLPTQTTLRAGEQHLLGEWLDGLASQPPK